jgi:hypothetical protein
MKFPGRRRRPDVCVEMPECNFFAALGHTGVLREILPYRVVQRNFALTHHVGQGCHRKNLGDRPDLEDGFAGDGQLAIVARGAKTVAGLELPADNGDDEALGISGRQIVSGDFFQFGLDLHRCGRHLAPACQKFVLRLP